MKKKPVGKFKMRKDGVWVASGGRWKIERMGPMRYDLHHMEREEDTLVVVGLPTVAACESYARAWNEGSEEG